MLLFLNNKSIRILALCYPRAIRFFQKKLCILFKLSVPQPICFVHGPKGPKIFARKKVPVQNTDYTRWGSFIITPFVSCMKILKCTGTPKLFDRLKRI